MKPRHRPPCPHGQNAFTMIELLTVIAIIAILAAIIFPVAGTVRENARRSSTMSNLREIQMAVKQYHLDNRSYPDYLFGPAVNSAGNEAATGVLPMKQVSEILNSGATDTASLKIKRLYSTGLYPEYINSLERYTCPNNSVARTADATVRVVTPLVYNPTGTPKVGQISRAFYAYDSFDASPAITGDNKIDAAKFFIRYSKLWTSIPPPPALATSSDYKRQLLWRNPPDDSYLTMTTWHVPQGKAIVVFLNGTAKVVDVSKLKGNADVGNGSYETAIAYSMFRFDSTD